MVIILEIVTDLRVKEFLPNLLDIDGIKFLKEIDSVNCGEGYDLEYLDLELRLYDDERSDEVLHDLNFLSGKLTWDQVFEKVVEKNTGHGLLKLEINGNKRESSERELQFSQLLTKRLGDKNIVVQRYF